MAQCFMYKLKIKSRYTGEWQDRSIILDYFNGLLGITQPGVHFCKYFSLQEINIQLIQEEKFKIYIKTGRVYQIRGHYCLQIFHRIKINKTLSEIAKISFENKILIPQKIDYHKLLNINKNENLSTRSSLQIKNVQKIKQTKKSYLIEKDWKINHEDGGLILISQQKKKNQGKILKFLLKKIISTGSFMGISFPVFAMKPQSILQTYCKSFGSAPMLFDNRPDDKVERIKRFVTFIFTFSRLFSDMDKPFNPVLGQTFQAKIGAGSFFAEQTSHHPPQSSLYFQGLGYRIYSTLQLDAKIGMNSATGCFHGDLIVQFEDGQKIVGRLLSGQMSGFIFGENKFRPTGACYAYDITHKIACTYELNQKDIFRGCIGKLHDSYSLIFEQYLKREERFQKFKGVHSKNYRQIYSQLQARWTQYVSFDRKIMLDFNDPKFFADEPMIGESCLLDSDSRKRKDIEYRAIGKHQQAQKEKEKLQEEERYFKSLRINNCKERKL